MPVQYEGTQPLNPRGLYAPIVRAVAPSAAPPDKSVPRDYWMVDEDGVLLGHLLWAPGHDGWVVVPIGTGVESEATGVITATPAARVVHQPVTFDGTGRTDTNGAIVYYDWDFGDATPHAYGPTPAHTYATTGAKTVTLVTTDATGNTSSTTLAITVVTDAATGSLVVTPTDGLTPLAVSLDATGITDPDTVEGWDIDWGDGFPHTVGDPTSTHTYLSPGTFTIVVTITDTDGNDTEFEQEVVVVTEAEAAGTITVTPPSPPQDTVVTFSAAAVVDPNGAIDTYAWDFGDTNTGTGVAPTHTYADAGTFDVILVTTDEHGGTTTRNLSVVVTA